MWSIFYTKKREKEKKTPTVIRIFREFLGISRSVVFCIGLSCFNSWDIVHDTQPGADPGIFYSGWGQSFIQKTFSSASYLTTTTATATAKRTWKSNRLRPCPHVSVFVSKRNLFLRFQKNSRPLVAFSHRFRPSTCIRWIDLKTIIYPPAHPWSVRVRYHKPAK